jgi:hypothetical protein
MPRQCSICSHPQGAAISKDLAAGASIRSAASRFGVTPAAVHRHLGGCLKVTRREKAPEKPGRDRSSVKAGKVSRFAPPLQSEADEGRCDTCGISQADPKPDGLIRRAERLLWLAEQIAVKADRDEDARLALQAVDRARMGLEQLMKVHGLLGSDAITVDNRSVNIYEALTPEERRIAREEISAMIAELREGERIALRSAG